MHVFGIKVVCLEPGYHSTPILTNITATLEAIIAQVPAEKKAEYGNQYFEVCNHLGVLRSMLT